MAATASAGTTGLPPTLTEGLGKSQLPALDGLRAIAALIVVFNHSGYSWVPASLGVLAFFVLSGFLITWLLLKEHARTGDVSLKKFYARRSLRILPAFYVYWFLVVGSRLLLSRPLDGSQAIASFFYVNNYYQAIYGDPNTSLSHTWSLAVEEQFYLLWPLAFLVLSKCPTRMAKTLAAFILFVWAYRIALHLSGVPQHYVYEAFECRADQLAIGCLLAVVLWQRRMGGFWKALCNHPSLALATVSLLVLSSALYSYYSTPYRDTIGFIVEPVLVGALIVQLVALPAGSPGWAFVNVGWMRYLGRISYSIYLYQQLVPNYSAKLHLPPALELALSTAVTIALASLSYYLVERPFLRLKDRFEVSRAPAAA